ncbi:AraC family transcriptional regulator [Corallococcus exiguus]|uniref:Helix-turn-helix domain-containing protein n=1 Tax=Corallococcus exiguus TaxID=83462 RepID=A0A7X5BWK5_9BACT|nr:AraC family transcriptional regulator [Corallococcus exiguus]NBC46364.1 helix-turn-helix domain-containing protein [Corallococcus exiguus]
MDALSQVLSHVRLKNTAWSWSVASAPWGFCLPPAKHSLRFHYVARGSCWLSSGEDSAAVALSGGELAIISQGPHSVRDQPSTPVTPFSQLTVRSSAGPVRRLEFGGGGAQSTMVCGMFAVDERFDVPLLAMLPSVVRITPDAAGAVPSFLQNVKFIAQEIESNRPGSELVLTRMADVIFIQILRAYIESLPEGSTGFLGALRDKSIAAALGLMHQRPEEPWTVQKLAKEVALSRSGFAARFAKLVGEPPLEYLTRLRMQRAAALLREGATLSSAAEMTGYASEASFSHAFRQWAGVTPGAYRRQTRDGGPPGD